MSMRASPTNEPWLNEKGTSAVEFSLVAPVLFFMFLAIVQLGWALQVRNNLARAADSGVRYAIVHPDATDSAIQDYVRGLVPEYRTSDLAVTSATEINGPVSYTLVMLSYKLYFPVLNVGYVTLSAERRTPS